jgi:hypothetical protein
MMLEGLFFCDLNTGSYAKRAPTMEKEGITLAGFSLPFPDTSSSHALNRIVSELIQLFLRSRGDPGNL